MFFKNFKKTILVLLLSLFIIPHNILAYSDYIVAGGDSIGIKINLPGVLIVGTYEVDGFDNASIAGLQAGDIIIKIDDNNVSNISDMTKQISLTTSDTITVNYLRNNKQYETTLKLVNDEGTLKTGLYVKDSISGIGTLTFIDPNTKYFGALGHEIIESNTGLMIDTNNGSIYSSSVTSITPSTRGNPGEKNATFYSDDTLGYVRENTNKGIFGDYNASIDETNLYKVASIDDIKIGKAYIRTVLSGNEVKEYEINILTVNETADNTKNIVFEITDKELLSETNGIIQGMSGSPIIQDEFIIGAVTHVVVDNPNKGYGILITNMLKEAEN